MIHTQIQAESKVYLKAPSKDHETGGSGESGAEYLTQDRNIYQNQKATSYWRRFIQLFTIPRIRRATTGKCSIFKV